ncbi:M17 family peptidase N-terminal domain-containing protein, partial [Thalassolituus sp. UBA2590]|uniref:M17 family peptidase N-terminal domain-containing protein n=1 Tax=Thalassolituus sp. UBA2590 TaxID=1947663 RepID=UPI002647DE0E
MDFQIFTGNPAELTADTLVVTINDNGELSASAEKVDTASAGAVQARIKAKDITGAAGSSLTLYSL